MAKELSDGIERESSILSCSLKATRLDRLKHAIYERGIMKLEPECATRNLRDPMQMFAIHRNSIIFSLRSMVVVSVCSHRGHLPKLKERSPKIPHALVTTLP